MTREADLLKECHAFLMALREWQPLAASALRHEVDALLIRFASPAAAPAAETPRTKIVGDYICEKCERHDHSDHIPGWGGICVGCACSFIDKPSDPLAPSLLPRVLAALESQPFEHGTAIAAELRRYIADQPAAGDSEEPLK